MNLADGIRKRGFRKWYERELMQSHAHMVLAFLCLISAFAAFELLSERRNVAANVAIVLVSAGVGAWAVRRYMQLLTSAEAAANQADCPSCGTYARFGVVRDFPGGEVEVACRACQHVWRIEPL